MAITIHTTDSVALDNQEEQSLVELGYLVQSRVGGLVREVRLMRIDAGLVLQGRSRTYYGKQLAQAALLDATSLRLVANEIDVV